MMCSSSVSTPIEVTNGATRTSFTCLSSIRSIRIRAPVEAFAASFPLEEEDGRNQQQEAQHHQDEHQREEPPRPALPRDLRGAEHAHRDRAGGEDRVDELAQLIGV